LVREYDAKGVFGDSLRTAPGYYDLVMNVSYDPDRLAAICREYRVVKLEVFGSQARGDQRGDSDVDILVTFEPGYTPTFLSPHGFLALLEELEGIFGRSVDLLTHASLDQSPNPVFRHEALSNTELLYAP
jgi:predicted nucleotidyltransferase